ncbi:Na/Pi cotransporter family protein [Candidatus Sumerlaeota bacterium]|nr:Na/Pi cotransporter family protein [Candidatus Sumerlaeota bacterium]
MTLALFFQILCEVVGGLGIFLLGMKNMSEGMQAVAGEKLRRMIGSVTNNRLLGCGVGTGVTATIQSSSITTVMVVGMVNAGIMTLSQAIPVVMGANIGTTITGWLITLPIAHYGLPVLGVSAFFYLFSKSDRMRFISMFIMGLGMVFFGLVLMKEGFKPLRGLESFQVWFQRFEPGMYPFGAWKCILVGAVLTAVVQSSSATIGITMALAAEGIISFETAAALVLGENIGTTITAYLASLGASTNAKRTSYAHIIFNVLGVLWISALFPYYIRFIPHLIGFFSPGSMANMKAEIAAVHTCFNVVNVILFLPFVSYLARFLMWLAPEKSKEKPHLALLDVRLLETPSIAIEQSHKAILRMGDSVDKMMRHLRGYLTKEKDKDRAIKRIFQREEELDVMQKEIVEFLSGVLAGNVPHSVMNDGRRQLRLADEYESLSDYVRNILKMMMKIEKMEQEISEDGIQWLVDLHDAVADYVQYINKMTAGMSPDMISKARSQGDSVVAQVKQCRRRHLERVGTSQTTPLKSLIITDILNAYRRIRDHAFNIAESVAGEK